MKLHATWIRIAGLVLIANLVVPMVRAQDKGPHKYIGAAKCGMCHKTAAKGDQFGQWSKSAHAKAYEALASDKALAIAKEKGLDKPPQQHDACLKCHVTGHGKPAAHFEPSFKKEDGVGCETCHGPGSDYKSTPVMKDPAASKAAGLVVADEKTCTACHNSESPTFEGFDFKTMWAKVQHPNPAKTKS
jgi:hypothetical protein